MRNADKSNCSRGFRPAFIHKEINAGLMPKNVARSRSAKPHNVVRSGCPGLPSNCNIVLPRSNVEQSKFHMIQLVDENQKKRSFSPMSKCSAVPLNVSITVPPWLWTMGLGMPVVPEEYTTHSG